MESNENGNQQTRVTGISVERVFNLGDYENIKYHVRVDIGQGDDPGHILTNLEWILNNIRAGEVDNSSMVLAQNRVKQWGDKPESDLGDWEKGKLKDARETIKIHEEAVARQQKARAALATLNHTIEHKDHKENWDDDDDGFDQL